MITLNKLLTYLLFATVFIILIYSSITENKARIERNSKSETTLITEQLKNDPCFILNLTDYLQKAKSNSNKELQQLLFLRIFDNGCMACIENQVRVSKEIIISSYNHSTPVWLITTFDRKDYSFIRQKFNLGKNCFYIPFKDEFATLDSARNSYYFFIDELVELQDFNYLDRIKIQN